MPVTDIEIVGSDQLEKIFQQLPLKYGKKPVVAFIAGQTAPKGRRMGHAGAIIGGKDDTAAAKMKIMGECGILVAESPADISNTMLKALGK